MHHASSEQEFRTTVRRLLAGLEKICGRHERNPCFRDQSHKNWSARDLKKKNAITEVQNPLDEYTTSTQRVLKKQRRKQKI